MYTLIQTAKLNDVDPLPVPGQELIERLDVVRGPDWPPDAFRGLHRRGTKRKRFTEEQIIGVLREHVLLRREGFAVNHKRLFRIYREDG